MSIVHRIHREVVESMLKDAPPQQGFESDILERQEWRRKVQGELLRRLRAAGIPVEGT